MELKDLLITPIYLALIYFIAYRFWQSREKLTPFKNIFFPALTIKILGAIMLGLIYQFYYANATYRSDTFGIFREAGIIMDALINDPRLGIKIMLSKAGELDLETFPYIKDFDFYYYRESDTFFLTKIIVILRLLTFNTYSAVAVLFAFFSFAGTWAMYKAFCKLNPKIKWELASAFFLVPSLILWGSGLLKDTLVLGALGWLIYAFMRLLMQKKRKWPVVLLLIASVILIAQLKPYILLIILPLLSLWAYWILSKPIKPVWWRITIVPLISLIMLAVVFLIPKFLGREFGQYTFENILLTIEKHQTWNSREGQNSVYTLGKTPTNFLDLIKAIPFAINVTLYRPWPWEIKNPLMALASLESIALLMLTVFVFLRNGITNAFKAILKDPVIVFCLLFTLIFAFWIGISTYNFGALSRYRIPMLPFFVAALWIILSRSKEEKKLKQNLE